MKKLILFISVLLTQTVHARSLVCESRAVANSKNSSKVTINLAGKLKEFYMDKNGVNVGTENYSFLIVPTLKENFLTIDVTFSENNHVQDEVASQSWNINLDASANDKIIVREPLHSDGLHVMDFVCWLKQ